jgi:hypothetical protein
MGEGDTKLPRLMAKEGAMPSPRPRNFARAGATDASVDNHSTSFTQ